MANPLYAEPQRVNDLSDCSFYHTMDIPGVGRVDGFFDLRQRLNEYLGPVQLAGQRVLEVGPGSGFLTFAMERLGGDVVAVELDETMPWDYVPYESPLMHEWVEEQRRYMNRQRRGFWFAHARLGSRARVHYGSAYHLPAELGRFDVATMASVLLHNRDPLGIIANCARVTDRALVIIDQYDAKLDSAGGPLLSLCPSVENRMMHTWWHLSPQLLRQFLPCLGFQPVHFSVHTQHFASTPGGPTEPSPHFTLIAERRIAAAGVADPRRR
jgi:SAM-dependent methyltransferase